MKIKISKPVIGEKRNANIEIDNYDLWNLNYTLAIVITPCLKKFKETTKSYPSKFNNNGGITAWIEILDKMIVAFELILSTDYELDNVDNENKIKEGLQLFSEYYQELWD